MQTRKAKSRNPIARGLWVGGQGVWLAVVIVLLLIAMLAESAQAQWGYNNRTGRGGYNSDTIFRPPVRSRHPYSEGGYHDDTGIQIANGIFGIIESGINAAANSSHNQHNDHWVPHYSQPMYQPQPMYRPQPVYVQPQVVRPQTVTPAKQKPVANKVVQEPTKAMANVSPMNLTRHADKHMLDALQDQIEDKTDEEVEAIEDIMDQKQPPLSQSVGSLGTGKPYSNAEKNDIFEKARNGDADSVNMATTGDNSPEAKAVRDYANAQQALNEVRNATVTGSLNDSQRANLNNALVNGGFVNPGNQQQLNDHFQQLDINNGLADFVNTAQPGGSVVPVDTLVLVGGMGGAEVIDLGNGTVLVGTQGATEGVVVVEGTAGQALGLATGSASPVDEFDGNPIPGGTYVINRGPTDVNFVLGGKQYSLAPDMMRSFTLGSSAKIEFYQQGGSNLKSSSLEEGTYEFEYADGKWDLVRKTYTVTLSNSGHSNEFHYVVNNQQHTLAADDQQQHSSKYPLVLRFDNGKGEIRQKRIINGQYSVAVTDDGTYELFRASDVVEPIPAVELARSAPVVDLFGNWDGKNRRRSASSSRRRPVTGGAPSLF